MTPALAHTRTLTIDDLVAAGFSTEQIARLEEVRARYPLAEFVESDQQLRRLELVRWLHRNGRLEP